MSSIPLSFSACADRSITLPPPLVPLAMNDVTENDEIEAAVPEVDLADIALDIIVALGNAKAGRVLRRVDTGQPNLILGLASDGFPVTQRDARFAGLNLR